MGPASTESKSKFKLTHYPAAKGRQRPRHEMSNRVTFRMASNMKYVGFLRVVVFAVFIASVAGCATKAYKSPLIQIYQEGQTPEKPYEKVKILTYADWPGKETKAMNYFQKKAEKEKADAVILLPSEGGGIGGLGYKKRWRAQAIKWK